MSVRLKVSSALNVIIENNMMNTIKDTTGKYEFCPNGNYWKDVSGLFDNRIFLHCDCNKCNGKMYELRPIDISKKVDERIFERIKEGKKLSEIKRKINVDNMEKVDEILKIPTN